MLRSRVELVERERLNGVHPYSSPYVLCVPAIPAPMRNDLCCAVHRDWSCSSAGTDPASKRPRSGADLGN